MGFLQFNEPQNLELFLTDKGKELILRQNGRGFMDLIAQCSFDDQDIDYRRLESNNPCANNPISGTCWYDMPDVRGKRTISEDLLCTVTGSTSGVTCEPCRCVPAVFIGGNRPGPIIFDPVSPTDPTPGDDTTPPPNVIVVPSPSSAVIVISESPVAVLTAIWSVLPTKDGVIVTVLVYSVPDVS